MFWLEKQPNKLSPECMQNIFETSCQNIIFRFKFLPTLESSFLLETFSIPPPLTPKFSFSLSLTFAPLKRIKNEQKCLHANKADKVVEVIVPFVGYVIGLRGAL